MRQPALFFLALIASAPAAAQSQRLDLANAAILQKLYPPRALAAAEQGLVGFIVTLDKMGAPTSCEVTQSSGFPQLDAETCSVITLHAMFGTNEGVGSGSSSHKGTIAWKLPPGITPAALPAATAAVAEKVICRRTTKTGSIARTERVCMTRRQWAEAREDTKANYQELQGKGFRGGQ